MIGGSTLFVANFPSQSGEGGPTIRRAEMLCLRGASIEWGRAVSSFPLPISPRTFHRLCVIIFGLRPSNGKYWFCPLYSPPVGWCNKFNSNVISCRHRPGGPTGASVFHIFSVYSSHLILLVVGKRSRRSRSESQIPRDKGEKEPNDGLKRKGMTS